MERRYDFFTMRSKARRQVPAKIRASKGVGKNRFAAKLKKLSYNRRMSFPVTRMRRLRRTEPLRALVRETSLDPGDLIYPLFVCPGKAVRHPIVSMPGVFNLSVDEAVAEAEECAELGIGGLLFFGLPESKDEQGSGAWAEDGIVQQALRALRKSSAAQKLVLIADLCLCEYTSHGHCGLVVKDGDSYEIDNDPTLELLARAAVSQARAGADVIAPSDMMDGRVAAIRRALDAAQLAQTPILSYASKFASAFYGPFRDAADSAPQFGDRRSYQMDGANLREALREISLDLDEGADMILMKPAMPYLDVVRSARDRYGVPMGAYQVSGEYSMLQAAFEKGWLDRKRAMLESLVGIRRAGADFIVTYFAKQAAKLLG
jgi:porphobilinogen synthase